MKVDRRKEHEWLQRIIGEWTHESHASMGPDKPTEKFIGTESVRSLGGIWILAEGESEMPGGGMGTTIMTLGYDPSKSRFVGTFIGSMMTYLWIYDGQLDESTNTLTLESEGPDMSGQGTMAKYRDVIELKSDDHRVFTSHMLGDDGKWTQFMIGN